MNCLLESRGLSIGYPRQHIARNLNLSLQAGELVCLLGPNGVGKSTLMRTLAGMQPARAGEVWLGGESLARLSPAQRARRLSVVLTERPQLGMLDGYALVALGRHPYSDWLGQLRPEDKAAVRWAINAVAAQDIADRPFQSLSDGQKQKLLIARALAQASQVMLLDEPTAFLDVPRRVEVMQLLSQLARETERAILLSSHDLELALRVADKVWLMQAGEEGSLLHVGAPEDLVLAGTFAAVFSQVPFDAYSGSFVMTRAHYSPVYLAPSAPEQALRRIWTTRALARAGYPLSETPQVEVQIGLEPAGWQVRIGQRQQHCASLANVLAMLKHTTR